MTQISPIPPGFTAVTPHLVCRGAAAAIEFYKNAFGAVECFRLPGPDGRLMHGQITIGGAPVMLVDEFLEHPEQCAVSPQALKGSPVTIHLMVEDVDATMAQAQRAGASVTMPPQNMFWGDRYGQLTDPFGHRWSVATHLEDLTPEQIMANLAALPKRDC